jgi:hypothetical protein
MASAFPGSERCCICNELLTDSADHAALGRITGDMSDPLHAFNQAHFHRTCLAVWPKLSGLIEDLETLGGQGAHASATVEQAVVDLVTLRAKAA